MIRTWLGAIRRRARAALRRPRAVVLMYHRVATPTVDPWSLAVAPGRFEEQIAAIKSRFDVIPLREVPAFVARPWSPRTAVAVTFDDGYVDNLRVARPILERRRCPATFFIPTGYVGTREGFWWDELAEQALAAENLPSEIVLNRGEPLTWRAADGGSREALLEVLWAHFRDVPHDQRPQEMAELGAIFGRRPALDGDSHVVTAAQVKELSGPLFEIGAHSITHPSMPTLPPERQAIEARESRAGCEAMLGGAVTSFAFPFGDHDDVSVEAVRQSGCTVAVTTEEGAASRHTDPLRLPRLHVLNWSGEALCASIAALAKDEPAPWHPDGS